MPATPSTPAVRSPAGCSGLWLAMLWRSSSSSPTSTTTLTDANHRHRKEASLLKTEPPLWPTVTAKQRKWRRMERGKRREEQRGNEEKIRDLFGEKQKEDREEGKGREGNKNKSDKHPCKLCRWMWFGTNLRRLMGSSVFVAVSVNSSGFTGKKMVLISTTVLIYTFKMK